MEKCDFYLRGSPCFELVTDHASLKGLLKKDLWDISPKLQPLVERTSRYSFVTNHCKGKRNKVCDALLRYPMFGPEVEVFNDPWMDQEESYTCEMINATVDDDIREDPLLADILMEVQQNQSYGRHQWL